MPPCSGTEETRRARGRGGAPQSRYEHRQHRLGQGHTAPGDREGGDPPQHAPSRRALLEKRTRGVVGDEVEGGPGADVQALLDAGMLGGERAVDLVVQVGAERGIDDARRQHESDECHDPRRQHEADWSDI